MPSRSGPSPSRLPLLLASVLAVSLLAAPTQPAQAAQSSGFRSLSGAEARAFQLPADTRPVLLLDLAPLGLTLERHQQYIGQYGPAVEGGQLTVVRRSGEPVLVIGAHYPGLRAAGGAGGLIGEATAIQAAVRDDGPNAASNWSGKDELRHGAELRLDPHSGRTFYRVETRGLAMRQFHTVDARTGAVLAAWDALSHDHGTGVKGDRKNLNGAAGSADNLTRKVNGSWRMRSVDDRLITYDLGGRWGGSLVAARDADNRWTAAGQRSAVDAQYYARATDAFLRDGFGFDVLSQACGYGRIQSVVRFGKGYGNAFWNGNQLVYGEGDGSFRALSGAQDVVAHELAHAVTQCTSNLAYRNEPGALNEAFSDIVAVAAEFELAEPLRSNCRRAQGQAGCPDWWIAEDVWRGGAQGIRNLADPAAGGQPAHYSSRYLGSADNGGVHVNSGIANHAFYLMSEGGRNARCVDTYDPAPDCDVLVPGVGLLTARAIAFLAYLSLPSDAQFCTARAATVAAARALSPGSTLHEAAAALSWSAVGVEDCGPAPADFTLRLAERSLYLAPAASDELELALWRGVAGEEISLSLAGLPAGWYQLDSQKLLFELPPDVEAGSYPFTISASSASRTERAYGMLVVDDEGPSVSLSPPRLDVGATVPLDGSGLPVSFDWQAADAGSGVAEARLEWSVDGEEWQELVTDRPGGRVRLDLGPGWHSFRVQATDEVGNTAISEPSEPVSLLGWQEDAAWYSAGWSVPAASPTWGTTRWTREAKRQATFQFMGAEVAWVADKGPKRGRANVFVDGVLVARIDLYAKTHAPRVVVFHASGLAAGVPHSLRIVPLGTSDRPRVGVDGYLVLNR